jgi:hypothetical protein
MINTGLAGYAAMRGTSLREARPQAAKHVDMIHSNLWREWDRRSGPLIQQIEMVKDKFNDMAIGPVLSQFLQSSEQVVRAMLARSARKLSAVN